MRTAVVVDSIIIIATTTAVIIITITIIYTANQCKKLVTFLSILPTANILSNIQRQNNINQIRTVCFSPKGPSGENRKGATSNYHYLFLAHPHNTTEHIHLYSNQIYLPNGKKVSDA